MLYYPKMSRISEPHGIIHADNESHYIGDANEDNRKAFKDGAQWQKKSTVNKACEWLKDFCSEHYIMCYSDCSEIVTEQILDIFKEKMEE